MVGVGRKIGIVERNVKIHILIIHPMILIDLVLTSLGTEEEIGRGGINVEVRKEKIMQVGIKLVIFPHTKIQLVSSIVFIKEP